MRRLSVALRIAAFSLMACGPAVAASVHAGDKTKCEVDSDYHLTLNERSLILTRDSGTPKAIVMRQGRLFVDDAWVTLSAADSRRIADYERGARQAMADAQRIGRDAADIALTALGEVAMGFSRRPDETRADVAKARARVDAQLVQSISPTRFSSHDLGEGIGKAVADVMPDLIGDIVGGAIGATFSGDTQRLERIKNLDAEIDAKVRPRSKALEARGDELCLRMQSLDRIDDALEYRIGGQPLNLLRVEVGAQDGTKKDEAPVKD